MAVIDQRPSMPPFLIDKGAAAELLGISERYVERLVATGELASVRIGRLRRLRVADVQAYCARLAGRIEAAK